MAEGFDYFGWAANAPLETYKQIYGTPNEKQLKDCLNELKKFDAEGNPELKALYIGTEEDPFDEGQTCLTIFFADMATRKGDWWRGSLSTTYVSKTTGKTGFQTTMESLARCGYTGRTELPIGPEDWMKVVNDLFGKTIPCWVAAKTSKTGRTYYVINGIGNRPRNTPRIMPWPTLTAAPAPSFGGGFSAPSGVPSAPAFPPPPNAMTGDLLDATGKKIDNPFV